MDIRKKIALIAAIAIVAYIILRDPEFFYAELFYWQECAFKVKAEHIKVNGVIVEKFIDSANHLSETITVKDKLGDKEEIELSEPQYGLLWKTINRGDTIKKEKNHLVYYIKNGAKKDTIAINYDCKNH